jgi:hypothetical protein
MSYDTNPAHDDATGLADGPSREDIEAAVLNFDDANNGWSAAVEFGRQGDYEIMVTHEKLGTIRRFDRLWEFADWTYAVEAPVARAIRAHLAAERELVSA